jgi:hypothetical protein
MHKLYAQCYYYYYNYNENSIIIKLIHYASVGKNNKHSHNDNNIEYKILLDLW